jgi:ribosomal-protein-alanine N-acetyltransferase
MYAHLETERLSIAPIHLSDGQFILELLNTGGWLKYIGNRQISNEYAARAYIQNILNSSVYFYHVIRLRTTKEAIGLVTLIYRSTQKFPDIGYALLPAFERQGYALEAVKAYLAHLNGRLTTEKVIAITQPDNQRSICLLERIGLRFAYRFMEDDQELSLYDISLTTRQSF